MSDYVKDFFNWLDARPALHAIFLISLASVVNKFLHVDSAQGIAGMALYFALATRKAPAA